MSGFKRSRPDLDELELWLAAVDHVLGWQALARPLWLSWRAHAEAAGVDPGTPRSFGNELRKRGIATTRPYRPYYRARCFVGLRLANHQGDLGFATTWQDVLDAIRRCEVEVDRARRESDLIMGPNEWRLTVRARP